MNGAITEGGLGGKIRDTMEKAPSPPWVTRESLTEGTT